MASIEEMQAMLATMMNGDEKVSLFGNIRRNIRNKPNLPLQKIRDIGDYAFDNMSCMGCGKQSTFQCPVKFVRCSRCKAAMYCGKACQIADFKGRGKGATQPRSHKELCPEFIEMNAEFENHPTAGPKFLRTELFKSWANQHNPDGSFFTSEFLARRNVLGSAEVGFWAQPEPIAGTFHSSGGVDHLGFRNGQMLLERSFPQLAKGWTSSLKANEYPPSGPPKNPLPEHGLLGWKDYLEFRELSPTTIAPLLLNNVLTVYQMIYHELKLYDKMKSSSKNNKNIKQQFKVFLLGVETELNQIPLFEELLYLLPGFDLELVLVSPAVKDVCDQAKLMASGNSGKMVIARQEHVLDLTDPVAKGRVRVKLHAEHSFYHDIPMENSASCADAVLALSAGLGSYKTWRETVHKILRRKIPFVITDQSKVTLRFDEKIWFPTIIDVLNRHFECTVWPPLAMPTLTTKLNPFHGIVNRDIAAVGVPDIRNGYIMLIE